jgi:hypothetical protein
MLAAVLAACSPAPGPAESATAPERGPLEGAWRVVEVTVVGGPDEGTQTDTLQPSLYVFARQHYSIMYVDGAEPRPLLAEDATRAGLTEAEVRATFEPFIANSGTYQLNGSTITTNPIVAMWPNFMTGGVATYEYRVEGDTLWLTSRSTTEPVVETTRRLVRLE